MQVRAGGWNRQEMLLPAAAGVALLAAGLTGALSAGWGFALFLISGALLAAGAALFSVIVFSRAGDAEQFARAYGLLFRTGAWCYVFALCAFAGHYTRESLLGRMELHWMLFGPAVLAALVVLDWGLYRRLVANNLPTWRRYSQHLHRASAQPEAMRRTLVDEVILHRALWRTSRLRWVRHTLIFWGFALMFATELVAVLFREAFPAFGWPDLWRTPGHPVRLALEFAYDFTGVMVLAGCLLALAWRWRVNGTPEQKYADTPTVVFLLFVVASGFVISAMRIAADPGHPSNASSFAGQAAAAIMGGVVPAAWYKPLWLVHVLGSCLFIAYVPLKRMVHSCATPIGRLMISQRELLADKKRAVLSGLMPGGERRP